MSYQKILAVLAVFCCIIVSGCVNAPVGTAPTTTSAPTSDTSVTVLNYDLFISANNNFALTGKDDSVPVRILSEKYFLGAEMTCGSEKAISAVSNPVMNPEYSSKLGAGENLFNYFTKYVFYSKDGYMAKSEQSNESLNSDYESEPLVDSTHGLLYAPNPLPLNSLFAMAGQNFNSVFGNWKDGETKELADVHYFSSSEKDLVIIKKIGERKGYALPCTEFSVSVSVGNASFGGYGTYSLICVVNPSIYGQPYAVRNFGNYSTTSSPGWQVIDYQLTSVSKEKPPLFKPQCFPRT